jgi:DNA-binding transcriptional LysR family regulator
MSGFNSLDLNLLRVFDAVIEERSVLRASQKVFLSQSAVSHSLARLREALGDELFVRTPAGMEPTARALALMAPVRQALKSLEAAVDPPRFDPATSDRTFTVAASDFTTLVVVPPILDILKIEAPRVDLVIRPVTRIDLAAQIDLGRIDAAIGTFSNDAPPRFHQQALFEYDDVLIASRQSRIGPLSLDQLAALSFVVVSYGGDQDGAVDGFISERGLGRRAEMYDRSAFEGAFAALGAEPRTAVALPHFLAIPALLEDTTLAAIVPRPLAEAFARKNAITIHDLPYRSARLQVGLLWHERLDGVAAQTWLHGVVARATQGLAGVASG